MNCRNCRSFQNIVVVKRTGTDRTTGRCRGVFADGEYGPKYGEIVGAAHPGCDCFVGVGLNRGGVVCKLFPDPEIIDERRDESGRLSL